MRHAARDFFPLDKELGIKPQQVHSLELSRQIVWLSGLLPYQQVIAVFAELNNYVLNVASIWRMVQAHGERLQAYLEHAQTQVSPERIILGDPEIDHDQAKGISVDGGMVHIRGEGWKEFKAGVVYDVGQRERYDPHTREIMELPCAENARYTAVLGNVQAFSPALWHIAVQHDIPRASRSSVTADGAEWIWNLADDLFPDSTQIVDWYHATAHLSQAAHALFPDDAPQAQRWYKQMQTPLFYGEVWKIINKLLAAGLDDHARYFQHHRRRMHYQHFRSDDCLIGSGTVESLIKQFKARLSGAGMRWHRPHAQRMFVIRAAVLSDTFNDLWAAAA